MPSTPGSSQRLSAGVAVAKERQWQTTGRPARAAGHGAWPVEGQDVVEMHQVRAEGAHDPPQGQRHRDHIAGQTARAARPCARAERARGCCAWSRPAWPHSCTAACGSPRGHGSCAGGQALPARRVDPHHRNARLLEAGERVDGGQRHQRLHLAPIQVADQVQQADVGAAGAGAKIDVQDCASRHRRVPQGGYGDDVVDVDAAIAHQVGARVVAERPGDCCSRRQPPTARRRCRSRRRS